MEAIIRTSGRQFRVREGTTIEVDYKDLEPGSRIEFDEVLYLAQDGGDPSIGKPTVPGAKVIGKVLGESRGPKLIVAYLRRRKNSRKRVGHRQFFTRVAIEAIQA
ncbi:MAG TPA: 50S ribosomal protein L21 [Planctomycetota bacterium]|nr:50S ribosomal protein L21 [Planctomycetota bacterium]